MSKRRFFINTRYFNSILHNKPILLAFKGLEDYTLLHFSCPQSFFLLSLQQEHPERIPKGSRTKRSSRSWFSRLFLDRSSIVSRSVFDSFSFVFRSTFDGSSIDHRSSFVLPSFVLRLPNEDLSKIYRRSIEEIANSKRSYY